MQKYSDEWCASVADGLDTGLTGHDANECDGILALVMAFANEYGEQASDVLRELADQLEADDLKRAGSLH